MRPLPALLMTVVMAASLAQEPAPERERERPRAVAADAERPRPAQTEVEVFRLEHAVADELAAVVNQVVVPSSPRSMRIMPDSRTNSLIVSGEPGDLRAVKALVASLDVPVPQGKSAASPRRSVRFELVLMMINPGSEAALGLPRTTTGVIDATDPDAVLAKLRDGVAGSAVTEVAKVSMTADDGRPWKSRQTVQIPIMSGPGGNTTFGGYSEAMLDFSVSPQSGKDAARRLAISCRIERLAEGTKDVTTQGAPPARQSSGLEFSTAAEDGRLAMAAIESGFGGSYVLFVRVK